MLLVVTYMKSRVRYAAERSAATNRYLSLSLAQWLLDQPLLGRFEWVKRLAGRLLKRPARKGVVSAQSRLGALLFTCSASARERRQGQEMLRQAARAGDSRARQLLEAA